MSMVTVANLKRMNADELSSILLSPKASTVAVVDVRDDDHVGGHIKDSIHVPSSSLDYRIPEIIRKLSDKDIIVFHCALSQQRGPSAALKYLRERQQKVEQGELPNLGTADASGAKQSTEHPSSSKDQEVYVLDQGFVGWQQKYGKDERLTEAYAPDVWEDYD